MMKRIFAMLCMAALGACSTQSWYAGTQASAEQRCRQQPGDGAQRCLDNLKKQPYPEYEKERRGDKPSS
ncbi:hypothetical protein [Viridibacterium curvum]|uniref:Lipoprotein n=1 Tax=Viridibacterium curvum TaxID=1101404 RepID=A0ABP9QMT6_9RHOO